MTRNLPRRLARALVRRARAVPLARRLAGAALDAGPLLPRHPGLVARLLAADLRGAEDPSILPVLERAIMVHATPRLRRHRAELLARAGELTAARDEWRRLAARDSGRAEVRARALEGRLRETDRSWLPELPGPSARLEPASKRRILHVLKSAAPHRWSGFTIRTLQDLRAQRSAGLEPIVVTKLGWPREAGLATVPELELLDGFEQHYLDRGPGYDPRALPADVALQDLAEALVPVVERLRPAILHVHSGHRGGELVLPALALRRRFGIPVVYEVRGLFEASWTSDDRYAEQGELFHRRLAFESRLLGEVDGVLAISEALIDDFVARGIARDRITLIPNGIDPAAFEAVARDPAMTSQLGLAGRHVVGYVGNLDHRREGIEDLIDAIALLRDSGRTDVALLIVGDGVRRDELEARARRRALGDRARFTGRVPHEAVPQYYAQMDLFANPRIVERAARLITPLKPYEAMALGLPVVVSDLPALREIVDPPARGAVAPPGDPAGLAAAIARLLDDPDERIRLGRAGRAWVTTDRTWAANGPRYRAAYERILGPLD